MKFSLSKYKGEFIYTVANYTTPLVTMVTNIISAAFLNPMELGTIQSVMILLPYIAFIHFGVFNGLNRNLAFYKAQNNISKVQDMVNASYTVAFINAAIGFLIGISYVVYYSIFSFSSIYLFSSILLLINLILNPMIVHFDTTYRSGQNFNSLGKITLTENFIYGFANLLPVWLGYLGKIIANGLRVFLRFLLRYITQPFKANAIGKKEDIVELAKTGMPLLIGGYLWGLVLVSDQTLISTYLGTEELGYYSLSVFLMTAMVIIPTSINTLLYPKASAQYGKSKNSLALRPFFWKALYVNIIILLPICILLYFSIEPLTNYFLPKYIVGTTAAKINLLTCLTFISNGPSVIIGVLRENTPLLVAYAVCLLAIWGGAFFIPKEKLNIELIAWLRFIVSAFISAFTLLYAYYLTGRDKAIS